MRIPKDYKEMLDQKIINDDLILSCLYSIDDTLTLKALNSQDRHTLYSYKNTLLNIYQPVCIHERLHGLAFDHRLTSLDEQFSIDLLIEKGFAGLAGPVGQMSSGDLSLYYIDLYQESVQRSYEYVYAIGPYSYPVAISEALIKDTSLPKIPVTHPFIPAYLPRVPLSFVKDVVALIKDQNYEDQRENVPYQKSSQINIPAYIQKMREQNARTFLDHHLSLILLSMRKEIMKHTEHQVIPLNDHVISSFQIYARVLCEEKWKQLKAKIHFIHDHQTHLDEKAYSMLDEQLNAFATYQAASFQKESKAYDLTPANRAYYKQCLMPYIGRKGMTSAKLVSFFYDFSYYVSHVSNVYEVNEIMEHECASYYNEHIKEFKQLTQALSLAAPVKSFTHHYLTHYGF